MINKSIQIRIDKAKLLIDLNENKKAIACLTKCLDISSSNKRFEILYLMVFPNYKIGNYEEAIKLLKEIMKTKNDMEYVNGLGELLIKTEKHQEFIDIVNKIMKNESKPLKAMPLDIIYKYGECLFKVTEYLKAEQ